MSLVFVQARRHWTRHPLQLALVVVGVALGVAVAVGIDIANASARRAFALSIESTVGRATHQVVAGRAGLDESLWPRLRVGLGLPAVAPVVERSLTMLADPPRTVRALGIDPFSEGAFRERFGGMFRADGVPLERFLVDPRAVVLSAGVARALGVRPGDELPVRLGTRRLTLTLVGVLDPGSARERRALGDLALLDIAAAQELFGSLGRIDRLDLVLPEGDAGEAARAAIERVLPDGASLVRTAGRTRALDAMTGAFRLNLTALSLLALVVGMFLVYNAMTFAVVQRRETIGRLRALGVTRGEIVRQILGEALLVGLVATLLGLLAGAVLGRGLVGLVTRTIDDLYFTLSVRAVALPWTVFARGAVLGVGATLAAALVPALEAASGPPRLALGRSTLEDRWRRGVPLAAAGGCALLVAAGALLSLSRAGLPLAFAGFFAMLAGAALLAPGASAMIVLALRVPARRFGGVIGAMAARGIVTTLSRSGVAIAALMTSIAVAVGVGIMIDSFRGAVTSWLEAQLAADVYVSPPDLSLGRGDPSLEPALADRLRRVPLARDVSTVRRAEVLDAGGRAVRLVAVEIGQGGRIGWQLLEGEREAAWRAMRRSGQVLVSEPLARRRGLHRGDTLELHTDRGIHSFPIAGVYRDYASDRGTVLVARATYETLWDDRGYSGVALFLREGVDPDRAIEAVRRAAGPDADVVIQSSRALRERSLEIFERTFTITAVLRALALVVSFVGVVSALMALSLERAPELGMLRALGMTPDQLWRLVLGQCGLMGLVAGLLSWPLGLALALVMVRVINVRSFGWSLELSVAPAQLLQALGVAVVAALLAGLWPATRMARVPPARALREE